MVTNSDRLYRWLIAISAVLVIGLLANLVLRDDPERKAKGAASPPSSSTPGGGGPKGSPTPAPSPRGEPTTGSEDATAEELIDRGDKLLSLRRDPEALAAYEEALEQDPDSPEAHAGRAFALVNQERWKAALDELELAAIPLDDDPEFHRLRSTCLLRLDRDGDALGAADYAVALDGTDVASLVHRAYVFSLVGQPDRALVDADRAIQLDPSYSPAHTERATALLGLGRLDEARAGAEQAIDLGGDGARPISVLGRTYFRAGVYREALNAYEDVAELNPTWAFYHEDRGDALRALDRGAEAVTAYTEALALPLREGGRERLLDKRGDTLLDINRPSKALRDFRRVLDADPNDVDALDGVGVALFQLGEFPAAMEAFERAQAVDPSYAAAFRNRGAVLLYSCGRPEEALADFDSALTLDPSWDVAHASRAEALFNLGLNSEAVSEYDTATTLGADHYSFYLNKGRALYALDRDYEAVASFSIALELAPNSASEAEVYAARAFLGLDELLLHDEALTDLERASQLSPEWAYPYEAKGWILAFRLGKTEQAVEAFDQALELDPGWSLPAIEQGSAREGEKDFARALGSYKRALLAEGIGLSRTLLNQLATSSCAPPIDLEAVEASFAARLVDIGDVLVPLSVFDEALRLFDAAAVLDPQNAGAHGGAARVLYFHLNRQAEGVSRANQALALDPTQQYALDVVEADTLAQG